MLWRPAEADRRAGFDLARGTSTPTVLSLNTSCCILPAVSKPAVWVASSRKDVRAFPDAARARAGYEVYRIQEGLEPTDWKPMVSVGDGVREIRIRTGREHRLIYVARFAEAVYVLHAFEKKTQKTTRADLAVAQTRYRELIALRAQQNVQPRRR
jgi:phage-related protein